MVQKNGIFSLLFIPFSRNFSLEESENKKFSIRSPLCKSAKGQKRNSREFENSRLPAAKFNRRYWLPAAPSSMEEDEISRYCSKVL